MVISTFFRTFASQLLDYKIMISKAKTLKRIKEIVDAKTSGMTKLKKPFECEFKEGVIKHTVKRRIMKLVKSGNSINWIDDAYGVRNINMLDTKDLHKILWQLITDKEKREIALEHLLSTKDYLN